MFENMGGKIKVLAKALCWFNIILGIIAALVVIIGAINNSSIPPWTIIVAILGAALWALISWIGSFLLCGYGELIESTSATASNLQKLVDMNSSVYHATSSGASTFSASQEIPNNDGTN